MSLSFFDFGIYVTQANFYTESLSPVSAALKGTFLMVPIVFYFFNFFVRNKTFERQSLREGLKVLVNTRPLVLLGLFGILSAIWSSDSINSLIRASSFLISLISCTIIAVSFEGYALFNGVFKSVKVVIIACTFAFVISWFYWFQMYGLDSMWIGGRFGGRMIPPNTLGSLAAIVFGLTLIIFASHKRVGWIFTGLILLSCLIAMSSSFSRSAMVTLVLALLATLFISKNGFIYRLFFVSMLVVIISLSLLFDFSGFEGLLIRDGGDTAELQSGSGRTKLWAIIFGKLDWAIFFGHGYASISDTTVVTMGTLTTSHAHNSYIQILFGIGIFGFFIFTYFIYGSFRHLGRLIRRGSEYSLIYSFVLIYIIINGFSESSFGYQIVPQLILFLILHMSSRLSLMRKSSIPV